MKKKRRESPVELWEDLSRELWEVKHGAAAPRLMTLDELDAAFKNDEIDAHTLVRKAGTTQWRTLGEVAGLPPPSTITLESESLMPVTSEIEVPAAKKPSKPPPLPRKSNDAIKAEAPKPVPRRSDDDIRFSESDAFRLRKSRSTMDVMSDEIELRSSDIDVVKLDLGKKKETSTVKQPAARLREDAPFTREEMKAARPRSMMGKLAAVAAVALVGGGVFAGVSAWLTGAFGTSSTHALRAPAVEAPAQPTNEEAPPASTATITSSEGSMLVLAQNQTASAPEKENESAKAEPAKVDAAKPEPKAAAAPAKPAPAKPAPAKPAAPAPLAAASKKPGKAPAAHAPGKPKHAQPGPRIASTPRPASAKTNAHAALPTFKGDKKGGDAKVPASKKAKAK